MINKELLETIECCVRDGVKYDYDGVVRIYVRVLTEAYREMKYLYSIIENTPTTNTVDVVHGHWIRREYSFGGVQKVCSVCKDEDWWKHTFAYGNENYCPNCGAKMDEKEGIE